MHAAAAATGAMAAASTQTGTSFMSILAKHPLLVFSAGVAAGFLVHKYRKEIIQNVTRATEKGKDFVLQQRENLEDLVAECKECADDEGGKASS
jgi:phosphoribulokinase